MSPEDMADLHEFVQVFRARPSNADKTNAFLDGVLELFAHADSQARQIAALKDDLLTDRAELILYSPEFSLWRYLHHVNEIRNQDDLKPIIEEANRQLAAEHPDLFREVTKKVADSEKEGRP